MKNKKTKLLLIKPQIVSVLDTQKALIYFRKKYPNAEITLLANLLEADYKILSQNEDTDRKLLYCPNGKRLIFWELLKLFFRLNTIKFDLAVILVSEHQPNRYKRAKLIAIFTRAKKRQYFIGKNINTDFFFYDLRRYMSELIDYFKYKFHLNKPYSLDSLSKLKNLINFCNRYPSICLALFSANSNIARFNESNRYLLKMTNDTNTIQIVNILIDIYSYSYFHHYPKHYIYFTKRFHIEPKNTFVVNIDFDWDNLILFHSNNNVYRPDTIWKGQIDSFDQFYSIQVVLYDNLRRRLDKLEIFQRLQK